MAPPFVVLEQQQDFRFRVSFGENLPALQVDEAPPVGSGQGPTPGHLLVAAVVNCMTDALLFAMRKFRMNPEPMRSEGRMDLGRNAEGRLRVQTIHVDIRLGIPGAGLEHLPRVLDQFEAFCTVGQSVAQGLPVLVTVRDSLGTVLKSPA